MKKTFDCVRMMRNIREDLSKRYAGKRQLEMKELNQARVRFEARLAARTHAAVAEGRAEYESGKRP